MGGGAAGWGGVERSGKGRGYFLQPQMGDLPRSSGAQLIDLVSCVEGRVPVGTHRLEAHPGAGRRGPLPGLGLVGTLGCSGRHEESLSSDALPLEVGSESVTTDFTHRVGEATSQWGLRPTQEGSQSYMGRYG